MDQHSYLPKYHAKWLHLTMHRTTGLTDYYHQSAGELPCIQKYISTIIIWIFSKP